MTKEPSQIPPFVVDADPVFAALRPGLRDEIRKVEAQFRGDMAAMLAELPFELARHLRPLEVDCPARFIRGLHPFFASLSEMMDISLAFRDALREEISLGRRKVN